MKTLKEVFEQKLEQAQKLKLEREKKEREDKEKAARQRGPLYQLLQKIVSAFESFSGQEGFVVNVRNHVMMPSPNKWTQPTTLALPMLVITRLVHPVSIGGAEEDVAELYYIPKDTSETLQGSFHLMRPQEHPVYPMSGKKSPIFKCVIPDGLDDIESKDEDRLKEALDQIVEQLVEATAAHCASVVTDQ